MPKNYKTKQNTLNIKVKLFLIKHVSPQNTMLLMQKNHPLTGKNIYTTFRSEQNKVSTAKNETIQNLGMSSKSLPFFFFLNSGYLFYFIT